MLATRISTYAPIYSNKVPIVRTMAMDSKQTVKKARTFSGIQPTGTLHLGNYFGAVQAWVKEVELVQRPDERDQKFNKSA